MKQNNLKELLRFYLLFFRFARNLQCFLLLSPHKIHIGFLNKKSIIFNCYYQHFLSKNKLFLLKSAHNLKILIIYLSFVWTKKIFVEVIFLLNFFLLEDYKFYIQMKVEKKFILNFQIKHLAIAVKINLFFVYIIHFLIVL